MNTEQKKMLDDAEAAGLVVNRATGTISLPREKVDALLAANRAKAAATAPTFRARHVSCKTKNGKIVLTLELDALESARSYTIRPVNPAAVRFEPSATSDIFARACYEHGALSPGQAAALYEIFEAKMRTAAPSPGASSVPVASDDMPPPLKDHQRSHAHSFYMSLPHSWEVERRSSAR